MTRVCSKCSKGEHGYCTGINCWCRATPRCEQNAALVADRASKEEGSAVA